MALNNSARTQAPVLLLTFPHLYLKVTSGRFLCQVLIIAVNAESVTLVSTQLETLHGTLFVLIIGNVESLATSSF